MPDVLFKKVGYMVPSPRFDAKTFLQGDFSNMGLYGFLENGDAAKYICALHLTTMAHAMNGR